MRILKMLGREREPLKPKPRLEEKQMNLKDFNNGNPNNKINKNVMEYLNVDIVSLERGDVYDEKER